MVGLGLSARVRPGRPRGPLAGFPFTPPEGEKSLSSRSLLPRLPNGARRSSHRSWEGRISKGRGRRRGGDGGPRTAQGGAAPDDPGVTSGAGRRRRCYWGGPRKRLGKFCPARTFSGKPLALRGGRRASQGRGGGPRMLFTPRQIAPLPWSGPQQAAWGEASEGTCRARPTRPDLGPGGRLGSGAGRGRGPTLVPWPRSHARPPPPGSGAAARPCAGSGGGVLRRTVLCFSGGG
ncbi:unnamed protein product [Arctogadus glacialis]